MNMCEFQQRFKKDNTIICNIPSRIYIRGGFPLPCSVYGGTRIQIHVQPQCCGFRCSEACTAAPAPSQANHLVRAIEYTSSDDAVRLPSVCPWWKDVKNLTVFFFYIQTTFGRSEIMRSKMSQHLIQSVTFH